VTLGPASCRRNCYDQLAPQHACSLMTIGTVNGRKANERLQQSSRYLRQVAVGDSVARSGVQALDKLAAETQGVMPPHGVR
jgi:uncharacterized protein YgbK (DUF1537 family)